MLWVFSESISRMAISARSLLRFCAFPRKRRPKKLALRNCKSLSGYKPAELSANKISGPRHAVGRRDTECPPASRRGEVVRHRVVGVAPAASPPVALARIPGPGAKPTGRRSGRDCCNANSGRCERGNHQFAHHKSSPCTLRVQTNHGLAKSIRQVVYQLAQKLVQIFRMIAVAYIYSKSGHASEAAPPSIDMNCRLPMSNVI